MEIALKLRHICNPFWAKSARCLCNLRGQFNVPLLRTNTLQSPTFWRHEAAKGSRGKQKISFSKTQNFCTLISALFPRLWTGVPPHKLVCFVGQFSLYAFISRSWIRSLSRDSWGVVICCWAQRQCFSGSQHLNSHLNIITIHNLHIKS